MPFSRADYCPTTDGNDVAQFLHDEIVGKTIVITGVSPHTLGSEFTLTIAAHAPKLIVIAARSVDKLAQVAEEIKGKYPDVAVKTLQVDLASFESARKAGDELMSWEDVPLIDVLVNNAGVMATPYRKTVDGFESQFATNHLGHFIFTGRIMPKLLAAATAGREPRIVNITSNGHRMHGVNWDDVNWSDGKTYDLWAAYGQSKTANVLFSVALAERYAGRVAAFAVHPGLIVETNLGKHLDMDKILKLLHGEMKPEPDRPLIEKTLQQGVSTHVVAAFDPEIKKDSGRYLADCVVADSSRVKEWATDKDYAKRLWELSEQVTGQKYAA
ncbi:hypothetical protein Dda_1108 [Drechslerella dactyloides]|uniref:Short-chain dehydrogenase n=1 Tax=Drechslerella dactyloides TaxID=74499 RepID=A0AAD6NN59_DREDA|nr:hypothetical protein Dda_1108 [Drechslerella dactyloides]